MSGILYVVGTPIGNLGDFSQRAIETLESVDFICAEDTRVTIKLLNHFGIKKPLLSYHEHNAVSSSGNIVKRLQGGENCAIVTDAGMPCISDPGQQLVEVCCELGISIKVVPGATAALSALAISGLDTSRFSFEGFLSVTRKSRIEHLTSVANYPNTMIFYEAPHKLLNTLKDMLEYFGNRRISLCRELTKIHEEVFRTTLSQAVEYYSATNPKGEFVLIIEGCKNQTQQEYTLEKAVEYAKKLVSEGQKKTHAAKMASEVSGFSKSEIYSALLED